MSLRISGNLLSLTLFFLPLLPAAAAPSAERSPDFQAGEKIYMKNCEVCHLIGRNLVNPKKEIQYSKIMEKEETLKAFLSHKNGKMPAFHKISESDEKIKQLREFLQYAKEHPSEISKIIESDSGESAKTEKKAK
ncbi:MAG: c-type cytochrome [Candidatus Obscuribacterales bacterium]|nr:c-type cytochrome [Candidatus Obscuribacterales bacterium]